VQAPSLSLDECIFFFFFFFFFFFIREWDGMEWMYKKMSIIIVLIFFFKLMHL